MFELANVRITESCHKAVVGYQLRISRYYLGVLRTASNHLTLNLIVYHKSTDEKKTIIPSYIKLYGKYSNHAV